MVSLPSSPPLEPHFLTEAEIEAFAPYPLPPAPAGQRARLRKRLAEAGCYGPGQIGGRRWPIGCVSLDVTQRCNLDCSLCYLSEHSEAVRDVPLEELFRRIDMIRAHYGEHTDIQVSGGEPTRHAGASASCLSWCTTSWMPGGSSASGCTPVFSWWHRARGPFPCACTTPNATALSCGRCSWPRAPRSWDPLTGRLSPASGARRDVAVFPLEYVKRVGRRGGSVPEGRRE